MTNNEAITTLKANYPDACYTQLREAVDAAIKALGALEQLSKNSPELYKGNGELISNKRTQERTETHACDCISRQAAIDALGGNEPVGDPSKMDDDDVVKMWERIRIINIINKLPSAQPEQTNSWCINSWCNNCKEYDNRVIKQTLDEAYAHAETEAEARFHAQQRWIPCSERLPEKEEQVLIYAWNVHYVLAKYREIRTCDGVYKMAWVTEDAYSAPREIKHEVICWMPLPEPYKEGES